MTVDDRLRAELTHAVEEHALREDEAYDNVRLQHGRAHLRRRVARQTVTAAVVLSLFASVAMVVAWRRVPDQAGVAAGAAQSGDRYRSTATIRVSPVPDGFADFRRLALETSTVRATLRAAHLPPDTPTINFLVRLETKHLLSLIVTSPSRSESTTVGRAWASAFDKALRAEDVRLRRARGRALEHRLATLRSRLKAIDAELKAIDPIYYGNLPGLGNGYPTGAPNRTTATTLRPATDRELNLTNERIQTLARLSDISLLSGPFVLEPSARLIEQTPPVLIKVPSRSRAPVLIGGGIGLIAVLGGALFVYRRRTRGARQVAA